MRTDWVKLILMVLVFEKVVQHIVVTLAFIFNWQDIGSTVVVNPAILMGAGAVIAVLFILCLWGLVTGKSWALNLGMLLALVDILGEFIAQGKLGIAINVSFIVATILLVLALWYRGQHRRRA